MSTGTSDSTRRDELWLVWALAGLVALPFVVAAIRIFLIKGGYSTAGDLSIIEMRIRDIPRHAPLVGPYSRYNWNHPGPALYYVLAPFYWLVGREASGLALGALAVNAAACVGTVFVARRRGGVLLAACASVLILVFTHALGPAAAANAWNPILPVMPFLLFLVLAWSVAIGDGPLLPWMVLVGSFVAQSHVGFDLSIAIVGVGAAIALAVRARRRRGHDQNEDDEHATVSHRAVVWSVAIAAIAWSGPIVDALKHDGGNVKALWHYFRSSHQTVGISEAWRIVSGELGTQAQWVRGFTRDPFTAEPFSAYRAALPILLLVLVAAVGVAAWRRRRGAGAGVGAIEALIIAIAAIAIAVVSIGSITGVAYDYLTEWVSAVAVFGAIALTVTLSAEVARRDARFARVAVVALAIGALVLGSFAVRESVTFSDPSDSAAHLVARAARALAGTQSVRTHTVMVRALDGLDAGLAGDGLLLRLERAGVKIGVTADTDFVYGSTRVARDPAHALLLGVSIVDYASEVPKARAGMRLLLRYDSLTPSQRTRDDRFAAELARLLHEKRYGAIRRLGPVPPGGKILTVWQLTNHLRLS